MANIFISYSHHDEQFARIIESSLQASGAEVFLSGSRLEGGDYWEDEIWDNLREADYFIFLASENSISRDYPKFELGGSYYDEKKILPVLIDIAPHQLPTIIQKIQAIDLRDHSPEEIKQAMLEKGKKIFWNEIKSSALLASVIFGGLYLLNKK